MGEGGREPRVSKRKHKYGGRRTKVMMNGKMPVARRAAPATSPSAGSQSRRVRQGVNCSFPSRPRSRSHITPRRDRG